MKKIASLLLCLSVLISLTGCSMSMKKFARAAVSEAEKAAQTQEAPSQKTHTVHRAGFSGETILVPDRASYHWPDGKVQEAMTFTWEETVRTAEGGFSLRGICTDYEGNPYPIRYLYHENGTVYLSEMQYPDGELKMTFTGDMLRIEDYCASRLNIARRKGSTVYLTDTTRVEFEIGEDGLTDSYTHYQPTGKKIRREVLNDSGFPVESHNFDRKGKESGWYEYTYREMPVPEQ